VSEVVLEVDGRRISGWKRIQIERELGAFCGRFHLGLLDSWELLSKSWYVTPFADCKIYIDRELVLTGYVDNVSIAKSTSGTDISFSGRDITSDLVDCSALAKPYQFDEKTLSDLVKIVLKGFPITYVERADPGKKFRRIDIPPGSRIANVLDEYSRYRGLFFITNEKGELELVQPGNRKSDTSLVVGQNIKSFQVQYDTQQRFSKYFVFSQSQGVPDFFGAKANQIQKTAQDKGVPRYRPLGFLADFSATAEDAQKRANWEATVRAAKMVTLNVDVAGWRQGNFVNLAPSFWSVNQLVDVEILEIGLKEELLISSVRFSYDSSGGQITTLGLERKDAYLAEPLKDPGIERNLDDFGGGDND
jgi:prophage tail gpP-like protein